MSRLERALAANWRLQERLRGILEAIDSALWSNAQMQAKLMHNSWLHPRAGRYRGMRGPASPMRKPQDPAMQRARQQAWPSLHAYVYSCHAPLQNRHATSCMTL